jgi:ribosomal protein S18 acetylase RimI-like enzyme
VGLEIIPIRDFGLGRKLVALWDGDVHVGQLEYRGVAGKITEIYALGVRPEVRRKGYARRILSEVVANPSARVSGIESGMTGFWEKMMPQSVTFRGK